MYEGNVMRQPSLRQYGKKNSNNKIEEANYDYPFGKNTFKISATHKHGDSMNLVNIQKINQIAQLQIENKITSIFNIFEIKLLQKYSQAINAIKNLSHPHLETYQQFHQVIQSTTTFVNQLQCICRIKTSKDMRYFWIMLKMIGKGTQNSKRQMLRINSKLNHETHDFQVIDRNNSHEGNVTSEKTNKMLMKKKQKRQRQIGTFKNQMEALLGQYQNYLKN